jgi:hypothetical protein
MGYEQDLLAEGLCAEIVLVDTEDGPVTGRCQGPVAPFLVGLDLGVGASFEAFACEGHTHQILGWHAQSELERIEWERRLDAESVEVW